VQITQSAFDGIAILRLAGNLDSATAPALQSAVSAIVAQKWLALDLSGVGFLASAGLRAILLVAKQAQARGGALAVFGLSTPVSETFEISGFSRLIAMAGSEAEAVKILRS
jgi:anti-sigma B factor antagonist